MVKLVVVVVVVVVAVVVVVTAVVVVAAAVVYAPSMMAAPYGLPEPDNVAALQLLSSRGGRNQRANARAALCALGVGGDPAAAAARSPPCDSSTACGLLRDWAWGNKSASEIQRIAEWCVRDLRDVLERNNLSRDAIPAALGALEALGTMGRYPGNCHKELLQYLGDAGFPKALDFVITVKIQKPRRMQPAIQSIPVPFHLPHILFAHLHADKRGYFDSQLLGVADGGAPMLRAFWEGIVRRRDPRIVMRPMCMRQGGWTVDARSVVAHTRACVCVCVPLCVGVRVWERVCACIEV